VRFLCFFKHLQILKIKQNSLVYIPKYKVLGTNYQLPVSRREGDSNPRIPNGINGFRDRPIRPLWHLSEVGVGLSVVFEHGYICDPHSHFPHSHSNPHLLRGERGIRTPGPLQVNGFQDRRNRPLCHLSAGKSTIFLRIAKGTGHWMRDSGCVSYEI
jgi:hypothetical protein